MKSITIIALIASLALLAHVAIASDCSEGECTSTVLVTQRFVNSADCTGNSTFSTGTNYTKTCALVENDGYNSTTSFSCSASKGFAIVTTGDANSNSCAKTRKSILSTSPIGYCQRTGSTRSEITWCNMESASANFKPTKLAENVTLAPSYVECNTTTGCTNNTGTLRVYNSSECAAANETIVANPSGLFGVKLSVGVCYLSSGSSKRSVLGLNYASEDVDYTQRNYIVSCSNGYYTLRSSTGGCGASANAVATLSFPTDTCFRYGDEQFLKITCPSAASALVAGPLALIMIVAFLLFL